MNKIEDLKDSIKEIRDEIEKKEKGKKQEQDGVILLNLTTRIFSLSARIDEYLRLIFNKFFGFTYQSVPYPDIPPLDDAGLIPHIHEKLVGSINFLENVSVSLEKIKNQYVLELENDSYQE
ncbi:MAG: hypothetical protein J7L39_02250 [Candidatus Aenigmarchaeota archaeon]|nr:hypothetical protein [Candidatus Aenigmarchaeota archaeon]